MREVFPPYTRTTVSLKLSHHAPARHIAAIAQSGSTFDLFRALESGHVETVALVETTTIRLTSKPAPPADQD